jgi:hypothetical protein
MQFFGEFLLGEAEFRENFLLLRWPFFDYGWGLL